MLLLVTRVNNMAAAGEEQPEDKKKQPKKQKIRPKIRPKIWKIQKKLGFARAATVNMEIYQVSAGWNVWHVPKHIVVSALTCLKMNGRCSMTGTTYNGFAKNVYRSISPTLRD